MTIIYTTFIYFQQLSKKTPATNQSIEKTATISIK